MTSTRNRQGPRRPLGAAAFAAAVLMASTAVPVLAAETGPVREVYVCNFNDGSDMDDLMAARDFYLRQMDKAGIEPSPAFVWTPIAGVQPGLDLIWFNNVDNLNAFGSGFDQYNGSAEGQAADARFNSVVSCGMSLSARTLIYDGGELEVADNQAIIGAAACQIRKGHDMGSVQDLIAHLRGMLESSTMHKSFVAYMDVPTVASTEADLYLYGVHENMTDYAARTTMVQTSDDWGMLRRHLQTVLECSASLWNGMRVVPAE